MTDASRRAWIEGEDERSTLHARILLLLRRERNGVIIPKVMQDLGRSHPTVTSRLSVLTDMGLVQTTGAPVRVHMGGGRMTSYSLYVLTPAGRVLVSRPGLAAALRFIGGEYARRNRIRAERLKDRKLAERARLRADMARCVQGVVDSTRP